VFDRRCIGILMAAAGLFGSGVAAAQDPVARLLAKLGLEGARAIVEGCSGDILCAAREAAACSQRPARLEQVEHPDSDRIRWVTTAPSVTAVAELPDGALLVELARFGRTAVRELATAMERLPPAHLLLLDLRGNDGGSFRRMLTVAALFTGPRKDALRLEQDGEGEAIDVPAPDAGPFQVSRLAVLIGPETASSAEILAGLLRRWAGARLYGAKSAGKDWLYRVIPVEHDWRLYWPGATARIPGERLAGGLVPDGPIDPQLAEAVR